MGVHDGHRERMRDSFLEHGLDSFTEINALELLLFYAIPRRDTNPIAHALLKEFGSLAHVLEASERELCAVPGVGKNTAALIRLIPQLMKKGEISRTGNLHQIRSYKDAGSYLLPRYMNEREEVLRLLCLDSLRRVICCEEIARGVVNTVPVNIRRIMEAAIKHKASCVILAHNHPDGVAAVSLEDEHATRCIVRALETVDIPVIDHILIAGSRVISFSDVGGFGLFTGNY